MKTMVKALKCPLIQSPSICFLKFSWEGMHLDLLTISILHMLILLLTIMKTQN